MLYKELRKVLNKNAKVELFIYKKTKQGKATAWTKIYEVKKTTQFDKLKVNYVGSQASDITGEIMLVCDLVEQGVKL